MSSLSFPDVNVWLRVVLEHHVHRAHALNWWNSVGEGRVGFTRVTQMSMLRLLTTATVMDGQPLTMADSWGVYDRLLQDERVALFQEPPKLEAQFRILSSMGTPSPKVWADSYLLAFAACHGARVITFDKALTNKNSDCVLLVGGCAGPEC